MSAPQPVRFTFDLDMGTGRKVERKSSLSDTALAELMAEARREGHAAGLVEGERTATAKAEKQVAASAEAIANRVAAMAATIDDARKQAVAEAVALSTAIARKLAGRMIAAHPTAEIEALIVDCLQSLEGVPHLVIRCEPMLADRVRDIATEKISHSGFTGRLVVLGDPDIAIGDARLEWADGGVVRDIRQLSGGVDAAINEYFAARGITPAEETST
jgi:flagellar assembly protein FliH